MSPMSVKSAAPGKLGLHKVSLACNFCRSRKRKVRTEPQCDGVRPVCGYCRSMKNTACTFDVHSDGRRPVPRSYVSALEARIKTLEDVIRATAGTAILEAVGGDIGTSEGGGQGQSVATSGLDSLRDLVPDGRLPEDSGASDEAMLDIGRLRLCLSKVEKGDTMNEGDTSNFCYYGPTSSRYLASADESEPSLPHVHIECDLKRSLDARTSTSIFDDEHELSLLNKFWVWQDIHFTVVDRNLFLKSYNDGERDSEWVSPMLIDMMLAIGEQFGHQGHEGRRAVYSMRAEATIIHELGRPRIATMQAIQLMAVFQMGAGRVSVAWSLNGLAVALSNRLGLHIDATDLVTRGIMSEPMKRIRDMQFWGVFIHDRLFSILMGVHPLHSRRSLSTRRPPGGIHADVLPGNITLAGGDPDETLPRGTLNPLDATSIWVRDLSDIVETMIIDIYAFDSPDRTPLDEYNMIAKNALIIQTYMENLPTCINAENSIRASNLRPISLHIFINLFIILLNRPFLGPHRCQTIATPGKPASQADQAIERRYRSLAFGYCRTAALRIIVLVEYFIHSPCFTTAYDIFSACTILLLSPEDPAAMKAVLTGLAYLDRLKRSHYWVEAAEDSRRRIWALARRWDVRPLLDDLDYAETTMPSAPASEPSTTANTSDASPQAGAATIWDRVLPEFDWATLDGPGMSAPAPNEFFADLDAALFPMLPSTDIAAMYSGLSSQTNLTQQTGSWWFMGSQPLTGFEQSTEGTWLGGQ
ncbi:hypothetical protein FRC10_005151 [Ceratobasidium sp. 414]|nr:hypothetical protein FRC10_005151 [Ceratobasidium sp. 414]